MGEAFAILNAGAATNKSVDTALDDAEVAADGVFDMYTVKDSIGNA